MSTDRTVLEHLLDGREALVREVQRLTAAIDELDAVIGRIGGTAQVTGVLPDTYPSTGAGAAGWSEPVSSGGAAADRNSPARGAAVTRSNRSRRRSGAKNPAARRAAGRGQPPKSIRVRILEMLGSEEREFGLAEIIDRIRDAGIQAHDDAVRSITVKLMKDGTVERVGRGHYRLARRETPAPGTDPAPLGSPASADGASAGPAAVEAATATETTGPLGLAPSLNLAQPWPSPRD